MKIAAWNIFHIVLLLCSRARGESVNTCRKPEIHLYCRNQMILDIKSVSKEASYIAPTVRESCNYHTYCTAQNQRNECVEVSYDCIEDLHSLEIKSSSTTSSDINSREFYLISAGYKDGATMQAEYIYCTLRAKNPGNNKWQPTFRLLEYTTYGKSNDYDNFCLTVGRDVPRCADSWRNDGFRPPISNGNSYQFTLAMKNKTPTVKFRFWLKIEVSFDGLRMECTSQAGARTTTPPPAAPPGAELTRSNEEKDLVTEPAVPKPAPEESIGTSCGTTIAMFDAAGVLMGLAAYLCQTSFGF